MKIIQLCNTSLWLRCRCSKITDWSLSFQTGIISISVYYINDNNFICTFMILILHMHNILSISKECIKDRIKLKTGCVCEKQCPWRQLSQNWLFFSIKVTVKMTRSLTLLKFERVSLVEYACQIQSLYLLWFKSYGQINYLPQTHTQTGQT